MTISTRAKTAGMILLAATAVILLRPSGLISAEEQKQEAAQQPDYKLVAVKADILKRNWGAKKTVLLSGNVVITQGDTVIKSDKIDYDEETQIAKSPGALTITDVDNDIRGDSGTAYLKERRGLLQGNVKMVTRPKKKTDSAGKSSDFKDPITMTCDNLEYLYKQKQATGSGNLKMVQKDRTITAEQAVFLVKEEMMTLTGGVKGSDEKGQSISAGGKARVSFKDGDEWVEIEQATGTFKVKSEEEEEKPAPAKSEPASAPDKAEKPKP